MRPLSTLLALLLIAAVTPSLAEPGPPLGAKLPFALALADQSGEVRTLADVSGPNGAVLVYVRSLDWCPFCQTQAAEVAGAADRFAEAGYGVVTISYDGPDKLARFAAKHDAAIPLLSDPDSATIDALGIRNETVAESSPAYGIPHPVVFVVAPDGTIQAKLWREDYKERPPLDEILAALAPAESG